MSEEANELTRKGNAVAENAYKLQLWDDCHDRQVIRSIKGVLTHQRLISPGLAKF